MSEYYLVKNPDQEQNRIVHRDDCKELSATPAFDNSLKYLGSFGNKEAAFSKARGYYDGIILCPNCLQ